MNLGKNIKSLRLTYGETQMDLAMAIGVESPSAISMYETGGRVPERDILIQIAKHYMITVDELMNGDYSEPVNIPNVEISDDDFNKKSVSKMFPYIETDNALVNTDFKEASQLHKELFDKFFVGDIDLDKLEKCINLFEKSYKSGVMEGAVNYLFWKCLIGFSFSLINSKVIERIEYKRANNSNIKEVLREVVLPAVDDEITDEYQEFIEIKDDYIKENKIKILAYIKKLKNSIGYTEFGDYYLAICYKIGVLGDDYSPEMRNSIGDAMIRAYYIMGNEFAKKLYKS